MADALTSFESICRTAHGITEKHSAAGEILHPFDQRNIHPKLPPKIRKLFDDGHYSDATLTAFKFIDKRVAEFSGTKESGFKLMMAAFDENKPQITLTPLKTVSEIDEQRGFRFLFSGSTLAIRNPRAHEYEINDDPDLCLDHLVLASLLLRRLEKAGFIK